MRNPHLILLLIGLLTACAQPEARKPVSRSTGSLIKASVNRNQELVAAQEAAIKAVIEKDTTAVYVASANGFWYTKTKVDSTGTYKAKFGDRLLFDYQVEDIYGNSIYSKEELGPQSYQMDQQPLISGLREGLKLMYAGESMILYLPSYTAYGYYGDEDKIGINYPLKVKVTLNEIVPQNISESNN